MFITVPELWDEMCTAPLLSKGLTYLHSNLTWTGSSPSTILGVEKPETLGNPIVKTACFCVSSFWRNTGVWRTDRPLDQVIFMFRCLKLYNAQHEWGYLPTKVRSDSSWSWTSDRRQLRHQAGVRGLIIKPRKCRLDRETYWSRIRRWVVRKFFILLVSADKIC